MIQFPEQLSPAPRLEAGFRRPQGLVRPLKWLIYISVIAFGAGAGLWTAGRSGGFEWLPWWQWSLLGGGLGAVFCAFLARRLRVPERCHSIILEPARLLLPLGSASTKADEVLLEDVQSVDVFERSRRPRLSIGTRRGLYVYPIQDFDPPRSAFEIARSIIAAIGARPKGEVQLAEMHRRALVTIAFARTAPKATRAVLGLVLLGFFLQQALGAFSGSILEQQAVLVRMGSNASVLVGRGEWWRLFVANFLHGGWLHLVLNSLALVSLGSVLEKLIGTTRCIIVFLVSALAGSLASAWAAQGVLSLGASTGIFGLLGAFGVMSFRFGADLPGGVRQSRRWWTIVLVINGALPFAIPMIDTAAHAGGFIAGAVSVYLVYPSISRFAPALPTSFGIRVTALVLSCLFVVAALQTAFSWSESRSETAEALVLDLVGPKASPELMNQLAWTVITATTPVDRPTLEAAHRIAARTVEADRVSHYLDTLATAEHRLGNRTRAARLEREAIWRFALEDDWQNQLATDEIFYSQLARFVIGQDGAGAPLVDGEATQHEVDVTIDGSSLRVAGMAGRPLVVFAQLRGPSGPKGVFQVGIVSAPDGPTVFPMPEEATAALDGQVELHMMWIDTSSRGPMESEIGVRFAPHDSSVDALP